MSEKPTPEEIISDYRDAYRKANGRDIQVDYFRGWYALYSGGSQTKVRARDLVSYTKELRLRASKDQPQ